MGASRHIHTAVTPNSDAQPKHQHNSTVTSRRHWWKSAFSDGRQIQQQMEAEFCLNWPSFSCYINHKPPNLSVCRTESIHQPRYSLTLLPFGSLLQGEIISNDLVLHELTRLTQKATFCPFNLRLREILSLHHHQTPHFSWSKQSRRGGWALIIIIMVIITSHCLKHHRGAQIWAYL